MVNHPPHVKQPQEELESSFKDKSHTAHGEPPTIIARAKERGFFPHKMAALWVRAWVLLFPNWVKW